MSITLKEFYENTPGYHSNGLRKLLPEGVSREIGHFNVFDVGEIMERIRVKPFMPYNRRAYYKISLISGRNHAEYADRVIEIEKNALLFATPKVPYNWVPQDQQQSGHFCVFTDEFLVSGKSGVVLDELPLFTPGGYPVFHLNDDQATEINELFLKMHKELNSDYAFKYDLIRNYVMELIHYGQKLQPVTTVYPTHNASSRVAALFVELMERQFPIESVNQKLQLRTANDYAERLSVHVNHLNKVLKEHTGKTTTEIIRNRVIQEAKILLRQTDWNVSEIAWTLGFEEVAHFSNFFRKLTSVSPVGFRS